MMAVSSAYMVSVILVVLGMSSVKTEYRRGERTALGDSGFYRMWGGESVLNLCPEGPLFKERVDQLCHCGRDA
jgi:hypothetical protein